MIFLHLLFVQILTQMQYLYVRNESELYFSSLFSQSVNKQIFAAMIDMLKSLIYAMYE